MRKQSLSLNYVCLFAPHTVPQICGNFREDKIPQINTKDFDLEIAFEVYLISIFI